MNRLPTEELFCATVGVGSLAAGQAAGFVADARYDTGVKITERFGYGAIIGDNEQRGAAWNRTLHRQAKSHGQITRINVTVRLKPRKVTAPLFFYLFELPGSDDTAWPQHDGLQTF